MSLSREGSHALAPELEYRMRYIVQESWKLARRSRRAVLLSEDVSLAYALLQGTLSQLPWKQSSEAEGFGLSETVVAAQPVQGAGACRESGACRCACTLVTLYDPR